MLKKITDVDMEIELYSIKALLGPVIYTAKVTTILKFHLAIFDLIFFLLIEKVIYSDTQDIISVMQYFFRFFLNLI